VLGLFTGLGDDVDEEIGEIYADGWMVGYVSVITDWKISNIRRARADCCI
jgi:hypothetical protein